MTPGAGRRRRPPRRQSRRRSVCGDRYSARARWASTRTRVGESSVGSRSSAVSAGADALVVEQPEVHADDRHRGGRGRRRRRRGGRRRPTFCASAAAARHASRLATGSPQARRAVGQRHQQPGVVALVDHRAVLDGVEGPLVEVGPRLVPEARRRRGRRPRARPPPPGPPPPGSVPAPAQRWRASSPSRTSSSPTPVASMAWAIDACSRACRSPLRPSVSVSWTSAWVKRKRPMTASSAKRCRSTAARGRRRCRPRRRPRGRWRRRSVR